MDSFAVFITVLLAFLFLAPAWKSGQVLLPLDIVVQSWPPWQQPDQPVNVHNPLMSDPVNYIYPVKKFAVDAIQSGDFPLWNPYVLTGYPLTYNTQAGLFYPLSLLYYFLPSTTAVDATIMLQMGLGGLFMYLYLRRLRLQPVAAMTGSILFLFNGMMVVWLEWQVVHAAIIWLPLQLLFIERLAEQLEAGNRRRAIRNAVWAGIAFAIPWLGGHWNWTLYSSILATFYLVVRLVMLWRNGQSPTKQRLSGERSGLWRLSGYGGLVLATGLGLSLIQVLPALVYLSQSHREALPFWQSLRFGLLNRAAVFFLPNFFGDPVTQNWWGFDNFAETTVYTGIMALWLAIIAISHRREWPTRFFTVWGALGLLWTLGTPLYGVLYVLPVFGGLLPSRAAVVFVFSAAVLAALGLDQLLTAGPDNRKSLNLRRLIPAFMVLSIGVVVVYGIFYRAGASQSWSYLQRYVILFGVWLIGSAVLLLAYNRGRLTSSHFGLLTLALITADLFVFGYGYNPSSPVSDLYPSVPTIEFLQADEEPFRIVTTPEDVAFPPNTTLVVNIANLSGYEPGISSRLVSYINAAEGSDAIRFERKLQPLQSVDSPLLDALNVKYLVTIADKWGPSVEAWAKPDVSGWHSLPFEEDFTLPDAGLHRIALSARAEAEADLLVRILSADGNHDFAHAGQQGEISAGGEWLEFDFGAFPSEWGREFRIRVEGNGQVGTTDDGTLAFQPFYLTRPQLVHEAGKTRVYLNDGYLPRAYVVSQVLVAKDPAEALRLVSDHAGELDQLVVLELEGQSPTPITSHLDAAQSQVIITDYALDRVELRADMGAPGYLVLADSYYPGWQATVDGEPTPIFRANSVVRSVYLPMGSHEVIFTFKPPDFAAGVVVTGLTLFVTTGVLLWTYGRRRLHAQ